MPYPAGGKYSNDPYYMTAEEEQLQIRRNREDACVNCLGRGWFGRSVIDPKRRTCGDCGGSGQRGGWKRATPGE